MANEDEPVKPEIGCWYRDARDRRLEVVAFDEEAGLIEVQYFDGDIDELDREAWAETVLEEIAAPEDVTGPFDDLGADDLGDTERPVRPEGWEGPWDALDRED
jgi:hypothetical protein